MNYTSIVDEAPKRYRLCDWRKEPQGNATVLSDAVAAQFEAWYVPPRVNLRMAASLQQTLRIVVANLVASALADPRVWVIVVARRAWYAENRPVLGDDVSKTSVDKVVQFFVEAGYATNHRGRSSGSKAFQQPSSIRATAAFRKLVKQRKLTIHDVTPLGGSSLIRQKEKRNSKGKRRYLVVPESRAVELMRANLQTINRVLQGHWVDLEITDRQWGEMARAIWSDRITGDEGDRIEPIAVDLSNRSLYRVFNNGSMEQGGRFYGGWWQLIPSRYRRFITINGKQTVELDYSAVHPTIMYHELGIPKPDDPYAIDGLPRDVVKVTFNALINAKRPNIKQVEEFSEAEVGMTWKAFLKLVIDHYEPFHKYFGTGYGLTLQWVDSQIAEAVMLDFADDNIPILPVHDSFLVHYGYESRLQRSMQTWFTKITGADVQLKTTVFDESELIKANTGTETTKDLSELLRPIGPYAGYLTREQQWWVRRHRDALS